MRSRSKKADLRGADADLLKILALQSGDRRRVRRVLESGNPISPSLIPHLIPLLAVEGSALDAMRALRTVAPRRPGALVDALSDVRVPATVRRRIARVLSVCRTPEVASALLDVCGDPQLSIRVQCARTVFLMRRRHPELRIDAERVMALVQEELDSGAEDIGLVFTLLALVYPTSAIRVAYRSLRGSSAHARGFALEYLNGVLPQTIREKLSQVVARLGRG